VERRGAADPAFEHAEGHSKCSVLAVPFHVEPDLSGALVVCRDADRPLDPREHALVSGVSGQLGVAAESAKLFRDLEQMTVERAHLLRRVVDAQEEERRHLVGDLHDGQGQTLTRVLYGLRGSRARLGATNLEVDAELARLESLVDDLIVDLRRYMADIRPAIIEDLGLSEALESFARTQEEEAGIQIDVHTAFLPPLDTVTSVTLYRAMQEAVMNARKHAQAGRMWIDLGPDDGEICLRVRDDGSGSAELRDGIGLTYMKDRVASLGGSVDVTSRPQEGTTVSVRIPVTA
jgi:signal transduction histidine kinase